MEGGLICNRDRVDTRSCLLDRTASFSLSPFKATLAPRGTLRISSFLTLEGAVTCTTHLGVSPHLPSDTETDLLRDYRPILGVAGRDLCWRDALAPTETPAETPNMGR